MPPVVTRVLLAFLLGTVCAPAQEIKYLPDQPGNVKVPLEEGNLSLYKLTKAEAAGFVRNLTCLRDLLVAQPALTPPRGFGVEYGWLRPGSDYREWPGMLKEPVRASGFLKYQDYFLDDRTGRPTWTPLTRFGLQVDVNDPEYAGPEDVGGLGSGGVSFFAGTAAPR